jgi:hypothetical protein
MGGSTLKVGQSTCHTCQWWKNSLYWPVSQLSEPRVYKILLGLAYPKAFYGKCSMGYFWIMVGSDCNS